MAISLVGEEQPILDDLVLECLPLALETLEHRATAVHHDLSLEETRWDGHVTKGLTRAFGPVDAERGRDQPSRS